MTDLSVILSPQQYDDGGFIQARRPSSNMSLSSTQGSPPYHGGDDSLSQHHQYQQPQQQKRPSMGTIESQDQASAESKKRARGRPRVEPKDDTAADRRRTQIRLAQRAYRNRKETAIQTLEKKVNVLQDTNEEMSKAFMNLYDTAVSQGLLSAAPEFGRQLQATTEKFVALARKMSDEASRDADQAPENESDGVNTGSSSTSTQNATRFSSSPEASWPTSGLISPGAPAATTAGNGEVTSADSDRRGSISIRTASTLEARHEASSQRNDPSVPFGYQFPNKSSDARSIVERVTRPLSGNANYPFGMSLNTSTLGSFPDTSVPFAVAAAPLPSFVVPPVPSSYSYLERTFGRRMQRAALEQALVLLNMPSPPPNVYAAVFGFCLLFESRDKIVKRVTDCISRHNGQTLHNWKFPFFHLGGSGSFFNLMNHATDYSDIPTPDSSSSNGESAATCTSKRAPVGNQGTQGPHKPSRGVGFSMGPFDPVVDNAREMRMDERMRITVPGFQGDFFDPDEIEYFLLQRGVDIPPASDFVTVEIDPDDFTLESILIAANEMTMGLSYDATAGIMEIDPRPNQPPATIAPSFENSIPTTISASNASVALSHLVDPRITDDYSNPAPQPTTQADSSFGKTIFGYVPVPDPTTHASILRQEKPKIKQKFSVNVEKLVLELVYKSVCLGRSPGVRPKDIIAAFWQAATPLL
ncbi:hypothetical protein jhhlp_003137 [Lomentospora prolificans]|uniref:BZIP domain-containing protein n=1 Tax=Lomentospora prolificans TaxID=41688 RepID=A0A2N3NG23_9PEZI|nr:hypothetical protein jhhlp_003137 [Lomentospora prolificans]